MSQDFLKHFLRFAYRLTGAERGLVVDADLNVTEMLGLTAETIRDETFNALATRTMMQALKEQTHIITNNVIMNPEDAPVTNTNFRDLRVVVAFPVGKVGVVYLDQYLRQGIITSTVLQRLQKFAQMCIDQGWLDATEETLAQHYEKHA